MKFGLYSTVQQFNFPPIISQSVLMLCADDKPSVTSSQVTVRGSMPPITLTDNSTHSVISSQVLNSDEPTPRHDNSLATTTSEMNSHSSENVPDKPAAPAKRTWKKLSMDLIKKQKTAKIIG